MRKVTVAKKIIGSYFRYVKVNHRKPTHVILTTEMREDDSIESGYVFEFGIRRLGRATSIVKMCYMIDENVKSPRCVRIS